jgi:hypothetical protein
VILFFAFHWLSIACWSFILFVSFFFFSLLLLFVGVGAGEEQARKVVSSEASRCGEDK